MSISWELPAVTTCVPSFQIWPVGNPNNKQTLVIKTDGNRSGVDVSTLPTDVYAYAINYDLKNSDGSDSHKLQYQVQGQVQFDTKNTSGSQRLVIDVQNDNSLILTGNTTNLTAIKLFQNNVQVGADIPVTIDQPVDLSKMVSGVYTVEPVVTGQQNLPQTLPFTIYTATPSATPLSREIDAMFELKAVNQFGLSGRGQLVWIVSKPYDTNAVNVTVAYKDGNKQAQTYKTTITKETNYGTFQDQHGNVLTANIQFPSQVSEILNLTVSLDIGNSEEICILNNYKPVTESGDGTSYMINAAFSNTTTLYISSEIPYTNPPVLDYLDVSTGVRPQWKALQSIGRTREGIVVDATGIPDGNYSYTVGQSIEELYQRRQEKAGEKIKARHDKQSRQSRLRREKLELDENEKTNVFTIGHGAEVYSSTPGKNLPPVLQVPVFTKAYDNFDKIKSQTDTLGNTTAFTHDVRNKKVLEISPKVDVQNEDGTVTKDVQPQTAHGYNERGFKIGVTDGNGHTTGFGLDEAGQLVQSILPSGLIEKTQVFDALERRVAHIDTRKNKYTVTFDRCDNQTSIT
ncbi:MAG: hypothetical protein SFW07_03795, partial [Gammaproteobacteria bacterium]|nr:hypothetical protein [Gammaproteobacteria bacterium]